MEIKPLLITSLANLFSVLYLLVFSLHFQLPFTPNYSKAPIDFFFTFRILYEELYGRDGTEEFNADAGRDYCLVLTTTPEPSYVVIICC